MEEIFFLMELTNTAINGNYIKSFFLSISHFPLKLFMRYSEKATYDVEFYHFSSWFMMFCYCWNDEFVSSQTLKLLTWIQNGTC